MIRRAVLDIGSNTIRLLIADISEPQIHRLHYQHFIARLGQGLNQSQHLSEQGKQRAKDAFVACIASCESFGVAVSEIVAVATAAIREAKNGGDFVSEIYHELGLSIQVVSGEKEAQLALSGVVFALNQDVQQNMLLVDIGGASTEFSRVSDGQLVDSFSEKIGVVRLTELHTNQDPVLASEYQNMKTHALGFLQRIEMQWGEPKQAPKALVGTAGTVTTLAALALEMDVYDATRIDNFCFTRDNFNRLKDKLIAMTNEQRLALPALEKGREDVIVAGVAMVDAMFSYWGYSEMTTVDSGLLEGLLFTS